jgi:hypothetical protein
MRGLFRDIVATSLVWVVPIASECFTEDWIQGLLYTTRLVLVKMVEALELSGAYGGLICQPLR